MLADLVAAALPHVDVQNAQRFVLRPCVLNAMWDFPIDVQNQIKWAPWVAMPFEQIWIEFAAAEAKWMGIKDARRTGYLVRKDPADAGAYLSCTVQRFVEMPDRLHADPIAWFSAARGGGLDIGVSPHPSGRPGNVDVATGHAQTVSMFLLVLNTKNLLHRVEVDKTLHNTKRVKAGRRPLFSHHVCTVRLAAGGGAIHDAKTGGMRAHLVRGHPKIRKTGVFMWSPFARGDVKNGIVTKDYLI